MSCRSMTGFCVQFNSEVGVSPAVSRHDFTPSIPKAYLDKYREQTIRRDSVATAREVSPGVQPEEAGAPHLARLRPHRHHIVSPTAQKIV